MDLETLFNDIKNLIEKIFAFFKDLLFKKAEDEETTNA